MKINFNKVTAAVLVLAISLLALQLFPSRTPRSSELTEVSGRLVRAVEAIRNENFGKAISLLENYPDNEALSQYSGYLLSSALMGEGNTRRALDVIDGIRAGSDDLLLNYEKYYLKAKILSQAGQLDRALETTREARKFVVTDEEKEKLYELEFNIALKSDNSVLSFKKAISYCDAVELRFIGERRDELFDKIGKLIDRIDFSDGQGLKDLYTYIEILVDYGEYRRARSYLLQNMSNWEGSIRSKAYFRLAWLDAFQLDFPEEASWTFSRLLGTNPSRWMEAKTRYYLSLFRSRTNENFDLAGELMKVYREFPDTYFGKISASRAFKESTEGAGLTALDEQLETYKNSLARNAVREATWELFYKSYGQGRYSLALHYLSKLESFYDYVPPEVIFWRYKAKEKSDEASGGYLKVIGIQKNHPLNYYSLLAGEKGWSRGGFELDETWDETGKSLSEREAELTSQDIPEDIIKTLKFAIRLKNHELYLPALSRLERVKSKLSNEDYLFVKSQWESLAGEYMDSLKTATQLLNEHYESNRIPPLTVVKSAFPTYYGNEVERIAGKFGIPESLVFAIIRQESAFDSDAYSTSGAQGLMQVMPATARGIASDLDMEDYILGDNFKPSINIEMGAYYISKQVSRWGNVRLGLVAYHGGPGNLGDWKTRYASDDLDLFLERVPAGSTRNYVKAVYRNYLVYKELL